MSKKEYILKITILEAKNSTGIYLKVAYRTTNLDVIPIKIEKNRNNLVVSSHILSFLNNNKEIDNIRNRIKKQKCNGSDFVANFLLNKYINNESN